MGLCLWEIRVHTKLTAGYRHILEALEVLFQTMITRMSPHKKSDECFGFPVHINVMFTLCSSLLSVHYVWTMHRSVIKNEFITKNCWPSTELSVSQKHWFPDHCNKYKNNEKAWNIVKITRLWQRDMKWANAFDIMTLIGLLDTGLPSVC